MGHVWRGKRLTMTDSKLNVLIAPAHYLLDAYGGSECGWSYTVVRRLSEHPGLRLYAVYGTTNARELGNIEGFPVLTPGICLSTLTRARFVQRVFQTARDILRDTKIDVIHHMLPFGYGQTFNPLPLLNITKDIPFVIGPLQAPLEIRDRNERFCIDTDARRIHIAVSPLRQTGRDVLWRLAAPLLGHLSHRTLAAADAAICPSQLAKEVYSRHVDPHRIHVVLPGVDIDTFGYAERRDRDGVEILVVSHMIERKRIGLVIEAFSHIVKEHRAARLRIVGDGPEMDSLVSQVERLSLRDSVTFEGFVTYAELRRYYQRADIFCTMSRAESAFPPAILEAMATGLPVVSAVNQASRYTLENGVTGFLIPRAGEVAALRERLAMLISSQELRTEIGRRARKTIEEKHDWDIVAGRYAEIYRDVTNGKQTSS
jgi:glycosyltransferase involved in cell wall biosynthesis